MIRRHFLPGAAGLVMLMLLPCTATGEDVCRWGSPDQIIVPAPGQIPVSSDNATYLGMIRVYVCERISDHVDSDGVPYHNAFLSFALQTPVVLSNTDSLIWDTVWDGTAEGFPDLDSANTVVLAAIFDSAGYPGQSDPDGDSSWFTVHEVDACAAAYPDGETGYNEVTESFTHSVFVDEATTTW